MLRACSSPVNLLASPTVGPVSGLAALNTKQKLNIFWWRYATLFTFIFFHTIHYRTWLDHITQYMMRLRLADVYEWNQWIFLGSHHISNCDEAWAGCCFSMEPVVFKVTVSSGIFWPSSPTGIRTCDPHIRGSSRAVSEW